MGSSDGGRQSTSSHSGLRAWMYLPGCLVCFDMVKMWVGSCKDCTEMCPVPTGTGTGAGYLRRPEPLYTTGRGSPPLPRCAGTEVPSCLDKRKLAGASQFSTSGLRTLGPGPGDCEGRLLDVLVPLCHCCQPLPALQLDAAASTSTSTSGPAAVSRQGQISATATADRQTGDASLACELRQPNFRLPPHRARQHNSSPSLPRRYTLFV